MLWFSISWDWPFMTLLHRGWEDCYTPNALACLMNTCINGRITATHSYQRAAPSNPRKSCQKEEKIPWLSHVQANDPRLHEARVSDSNTSGPVRDIIALKRKQHGNANTADGKKLLSPEISYVLTAPHCVKPPAPMSHGDQFLWLSHHHWGRLHMGQPHKHPPCAATRHPSLSSASLGSYLLFRAKACIKIRYAKKTPCFCRTLTCFRGAEVMEHFPTEITKQNPTSNLCFGQSSLLQYFLQKWLGSNTLLSPLLHGPRPSNSQQETSGTCIARSKSTNRAAGKKCPITCILWREGRVKLWYCLKHTCEPAGYFPESSNRVYNSLFSEI